jgi:predicted alpha/beta hydrolase family esterase
VAWWAAHSRSARVAGALLVAPPDIERADNRANPRLGAAGAPAPALASAVVASSDDPFGSLRARQLAAGLGQRLS